MGKFKDFLKNAVFEEENEKEKTVKQQAAPEPDKQTNFRLVAREEKAKITEASSTIEDEGEVNEAILDMLENDLEQENIPGPDYLELKAAAEDEESIKTEPDERKRYRQAFSNMKRFFPDAGVTEDRIFDSVEHYKKVLQAREADAKDELERKLQNEVVMLRGKVEADERELQRKEEQIRLERQKLEEKKATIAEREKSLTKKGKDFIKTAVFMREALDSDLKKIKEYLK